jgi:hypothetical protein
LIDLARSVDTGIIVVDLIGVGGGVAGKARKGSKERVTAMGRVG